MVKQSDESNNISFFFHLEKCQLFIKLSTTASNFNILLIFINTIKDYGASCLALITISIFVVDNFGDNYVSKTLFMCLAFRPIFVTTHVNDDVGHFTFSIKFIVPHAVTDEGPFRKEINN